MVYSIFWPSLWSKQERIVIGLAGVSTPESYICEIFGVVERFSKLPEVIQIVSTSIPSDKVWLRVGTSVCKIFVDESTAPNELTTELQEIRRLILETPHFSFNRLLSKFEEYGGRQQTTQPLRVLRRAAVVLREVPFLVSRKAISVDFLINRYNQVDWSRVRELTDVRSQSLDIYYILETLSDYVGVPQKIESLSQEAGEICRFKNQNEVEIAILLLPKQSDSITNIPKIFHQNIAKPLVDHIKERFEQEEQYKIQIQWPIADIVTKMQKKRIQTISRKIDLVRPVKDSDEKDIPLVVFEHTTAPQTREVRYAFELSMLWKSRKGEGLKLSYNEISTSAWLLDNGYDVLMALTQQKGHPNVFSYFWFDKIKSEIFIVSSDVVLNVDIVAELLHYPDRLSKEEQIYLLEQTSGNSESLGEAAIQLCFHLPEHWVRLQKHFPRLSSELLGEHFHGLGRLCEIKDRFWLAKPNFIPWVYCAYIYNEQVNEELSKTVIIYFEKDETLFVDILDYPRVHASIVVDIWLYGKLDCIPCKERSPDVLQAIAERMAISVIAQSDVEVLRNVSALPDDIRQIVTKKTISRVIAKHRTNNKTSFETDDMNDTQEKEQTKALGVFFRCSYYN